MYYIIISILIGWAVASGLYVRFMGMSLDDIYEIMATKELPVTPQVALKAIACGAIVSLLAYQLLRLMF